MGLVVIALGAGVWGLTRLFPGSGQDWASISYNLGFAALVASSLFARKLKLGETLRYIALWGVIAGVLGLGYSLRGPITEAFVSARSALIPSYAVAAGDRTLVLSEGENGAYTVFGRVNGQRVRFMIDTGASDIVLSPQDAERLGVNMAALSFSRVSETANGLGRGAPYTLDSLAVEPIHFSHVAVEINQAPMSESLLGLSFLRRLESYSFKDGKLILRWRG
jgi:aspartyl protease family protein